ncbi:hypothetical protein DFP72DRAFT_762048, partial [Ephemerocybe angulata]
NTCAGPCTVFNGVGNVCISAPDTTCLQASSNIAFCSTPNCVAPCTQLVNCIQNLNDGFCFTPETRSIIAP